MVNRLQTNDPNSSADCLDESQSESQQSHDESQSESQPSHDETSIPLPDPWALEDGAIEMTTSPQDKIGSLDDRHWKELKDSGVSETIAALNFWTIDDARDADNLLNRNANRKWVHSNNLVPGFAIAGVDPKTGERTFLGAQFKPDEPPVDQKGKPIKYVGASGERVYPLFLDTGIPDYWESIASDWKIPIFETEGGKKAGCLLSLGEAAISVPGVTTGQVKGVLHKWFKDFYKPGRNVYLAYDADWKENPNVLRALRQKGRLIRALGAMVYVVDVITGKGIDDYLMSQPDPKVALDALKESSITYEQWLDEAQEFERGMTKPSGSKRVQDFRACEEKLGHRLRFNSLLKQVELDGRKLDLGRVQLVLEIDHGFNLQSNREDCQDIISTLAERNTYSPVMEFLEQCHADHGNDTSVLDGFAERYFGETNPIADTLVKRWLISAVARVYQPGCKVDHLLVLQGKTGYRKSTFFEILSNGWFEGDLNSATNDKDQLLKLHNAWIIELAELGSIFRKKDVDTFKNFVTTKSDYVRKPYGRSVEEMRRTSVFGATVNEDTFLNDPTGSRRFWILQVKKQIDTDRLDRESDLIWAAAVALYKRGEPWHLTDLEAAATALNNEDFQEIDVWLETVRSFVKNQTSVTSAQVLEQGLKLEIGRLDKSMQMRISKCMTFLGWKQNRKTIEGQRVRFWEPPDGLPDQPTSPFVPPVARESEPAVVDWLSDQSIDGMVETVKGCVLDETTELIESVFDQVPTDIKDQVRRRVLDAARPQSQIKLTV